MCILSGSFVSTKVFASDFVVFFFPYTLVAGNQCSGSTRRYRPSFLFWHFVWCNVVWWGLRGKQFHIYTHPHSDTHIYTLYLSHTHMRAQGQDVYSSFTSAADPLGLGTIMRTSPDISICTLDLQTYKLHANIPDIYITLKQRSENNKDICQKYDE